MKNVQVNNIIIKNRTELGKNGSGRLRKAGWIPITVTAHGQSGSYQINGNDLKIFQSDGMSESKLYQMTLEGDASGSFEVFIKDYQMNHLTDEIIHLDFYRITRGEKITTKVAIHYDGVPVGIKTGGIQEVFLNEIEVSCLPRNLPASINIDITALDLHDSLHGSDLPQIEGVEYIHLNPDTVLLSIVLPKTKITEESADQEAEAE